MVQYVPVSTTTRPVTQTADVAVNIEFKKPILSLFIDAIGKLRSIPPIKITIAKPMTIICDAENSYLCLSFGILIISFSFFC